MRLCARAEAHILRLLYGLSFTLLVSRPTLAQEVNAADSNAPSAQALPAWTWVEKCHVQRGHKLTDFGTSGSLLTVADNQTIVTHPFAGKNSTGASLLGTLKQDLWPGGSLIAYGEGGTTYTLDHIIRDSLGTNGLVEQTSVYLSRLFLLQDVADRRLQLALGRILLSDYFDTNRIANCEFTQFLSSCLVNNPTIPFPAIGMGGAARVLPAPWLYLQGAIANAAARTTNYGFDTASYSFGSTFGMFEFGLAPFAGPHGGTYRFLTWYNPSSDESRVNHGFAVSFDQYASDRLSFFFRYGWAKAPVNALTDFVSVGALLEKPLPGRDHDSVQGALAWGHATPRNETLVEVSYFLHVTDSLALTPLVQIIADPAQNPQDDTFVLAGLRAVYVF